MTEPGREEDEVRSRKMVPLESHPDFVVDRLLLTEERFRDTQRSCHGCTMVLWAVVERDGELVPHGIPKRAAVQREGFTICTADACLSYKARGIKARKIFCLECLRLRERGGGSKPFDECFRPRVGGGYEQLLGTCLHCELGHGVQCKLRESDDTTCPSAVWKRDHPKNARNAEKRKDPDTQELTPVPCDWRRCASWRDGFLSDLVNLPNPQDYLFFYPGAAPRDPVYHTLRRTAPLRRHEWAFLWPLPELPPLDSIFFVLSHQPSKLACDRPPPHAGVLSYRVRPPFWSGVFFFARAGWLYGHYERVADAGPEFAPLERKQRVAEDKVKSTLEIPADLYERELPHIIRDFQKRAELGAPLHTGTLPGNFMLIANVRQKWEREGSERVLRAHVVEPDLRAKGHGTSAKRPDWPVLVRLVPGAQAQLECRCTLKAAGGKCYHKGVLEALHPELGSWRVYGSADAHVRTTGKNGKPSYKDLNGKASKALTVKVRESDGGEIVEDLTFYIAHTGVTGTLIAERKRRDAPAGGSEWACSKCPPGKTDLEGRCVHSFREATGGKVDFSKFVPQGNGLEVPTSPEEVWGQDYGVKPYPKLGTATAVVCTGCPPGYRNVAENARETRSRTCPHLAAFPSARAPVDRTAEQLRESPIHHGPYLRVAHVCTAECELRPCGELPPRHDRVDQRAEHDATLAEVSEWCARGAFCQARPVGPPPCGGVWRLEWTGQARLLRSNSLQAITLGTWRCHEPCSAKCTLKFDAASLGLYFLAPEVLCTQLVLKNMEDALYAHQSFGEIAQAWDGIARRTSSRIGEGSNPEPTGKQGGEPPDEDPETKPGAKPKTKDAEPAWDAILGTSGTRSLSEGKARDAVRRYIQHLDDHQVERDMRLRTLEATASPAVPPRRPDFIPATGNEKSPDFVLFVPPAEPLDLVGAKVQKFFRENEEKRTEGRTYLGTVTGYAENQHRWKVSFEDGDGETMCFKELAPLVYELPHGYVDNNQGGSGGGRPVAPFPQIIGWKILWRMEGWEKDYVGEVMERVGPKKLNNGEKGGVYRVFYEEDGDQHELEYEEVLEGRLAYESLWGSGEATGEDSKPRASASIGDINRPAALGRCSECAAAGGCETVVIDATRIQYQKKMCDRYGEPAAMVSFFHPNGQKFLAPPLSPYTLKCVCEADGSVLDIPKEKDPQTETSKLKLIRRFDRVEIDGDMEQVCPAGALLMRWSCGRTTWPDQGTNVNAGLPVKGNEEFGDESEVLYARMLALLPRCVSRVVRHVVSNGHGVSGRRKRCPEGPWRGFFYHLGCPETDDALIPRDLQSVVLGLLLARRASRPTVLTAEQFADLRSQSPVLAKLFEAGASAGPLSVDEHLIQVLEPVLIHLLQMSYFVVDLEYGARAVEEMKHALAEASAAGVSGEVHRQRAEARLRQIERYMYRRFWFMEERARDFGPNAPSYVQNATRLCSFELVRPITQNPDLDLENGRSRKAARNLKCTTPIENLPPRIKKAVEARLAVRAKFGDNLAIIACGHGVVLDYIIGLEPESVKDVIAYLETRYACRPPKVVINDNACQAERSGKLRNPNFTAGTCFCLDSFHGFGHRCNVHHYVYVNRCPGMRDFTSIVESLNDMIQEYDSVLYNMRVDTVKLLINFVFRRHNLDINVAYAKTLARLH